MQSQARNTATSDLDTTISKLEKLNLEERIATLEDTISRLKAENEGLRNQIPGTDSLNTSSISQAKNWASLYDFSVISFNATLNTKMEKIREFVEHVKPTLVIISEIGRPKWKLEEKCPFQIKEYNGPKAGFHSGRKVYSAPPIIGDFITIEASNLQSNGVAMWIRNEDSNLNVKNITNELKVPGGSASVEMNYCVLEIKLQIPSYPLIAVGIYKSPNQKYCFQSFYERFSKLLKILQEKYEKCWILVAGDFNIDISEANAKQNGDVLKYLELCKAFGLVQRINKPTRISKTKNSCLDHIMTNFKIEEADVLDHNISDHQVTMAAWNQTKDF